MNFPIKYYRATQAGAPVLSGTKGAMTALLDACLVTGFGLKGVTRLSCEAGLVTVTVDGGHGYENGDIVRIDGAVPEVFNGEHVITVRSPASFTYALAAAPAATATGSITVKIAPLGWEKVHTAANKAAYCSRRVEGNGYHLRVDHDTDARNVRVRGYLAMSDADTGTDPFPSTTVAGGGLHWGASDLVNGAPREWSLIGDAGIFYFLPRQAPNYNHVFYGFGDLVSYKAGDAHACVLMGQDHIDAIYPSWGLESASLRSEAGRYIARRYFQVGASRRFALAGSSATNYFGRGLAFPSPIDNSVHLFRVQVLDDQLRGELPGILHCVEDAPFAHRYVLKGVPGLGERLRDVLFHDLQDGRLSLDLTGPWR